MDTNRHEFFGQVWLCSALFGLGLLLSGCPMVDFKELNFTRERPDERELVGGWRPTKKTLQFIRTHGNYSEVPHKIGLYADHTITVKNMPDWWTNGFGKSNGDFDSFTGTWKLVERGEWPFRKWELLVFGPEVGISINLY